LTEASLTALDVHRDSGTPAASNGGASTIRVFIVAKTRVYRETLAEALGREPGIAVVGTCGDYRELVRRVAQDEVDVALIDPESRESLTAIEASSSPASDVKVIALGVTEDNEEVIAWAEAGVSGFVHHDCSIGDLAIAIDSVARGEMPCSPRIAAALVRHVASLAADRHANGRGTQLTPRELEIVGLIDGGLSNKQIARRLQIELATVKNHVHNILEKLNVQSRLEAAARFRELAGEGATRPSQNGMPAAPEKLSI
jgi:DNA-binding NarL/FixJ family response regulator